MWKRRNGDVPEKPRDADKPPPSSKPIHRHVQAQSSAVPVRTNSKNRPLQQAPAAVRSQHPNGPVPANGFSSNGAVKTHANPPLNNSRPSFGHNNGAEENEDELDCCGGPYGVGQLSRAGFKPSQRRVSILSVLGSDTDLESAGYSGEPTSLSDNSLEARAEKLPTRRIIDTTSVPLRVGSTLAIRPTAVSVHDLFLGCYIKDGVVLPGTSTACCVEKLKQDMLVAYWPHRETGIMRKEEIKPGVLVAVKFPGSYWFHRGAILKTDSETALNIKVLILDVGIAVYVRPHSIYPLKQRFAEQPPYALTCKIVGVDQPHQKLKAFFQEAERKQSTIQAVVCGFGRSSHGKPYASNLCVFLEAVVMVDGVDLAVKIAKFVPRVQPVLPVENLLPEVRLSEGVQSEFVVDFNGLDSEHYYFDLIENYSFG